MTDRELLELAAKAAGHRITWGEKYRVGDDEVDCTDLPYVMSDSPDESPCYWNPLEDDGDALRLAVALGLDVVHRREFFSDVPVAVTAATSPEDYDNCETEYDGNPHAATRRAIVRAAAVLGSTK